MTLEESFGDWLRLINQSLLMQTLSKVPMDNICPVKDDVFKAFQLCSLKDCRVVFLGQDPYPQKGVATGIAFANSSDTPESQYSPSLEVLRESVIDYTIPHRTINFAPDLEKWEEQGVLLLNSALSCEMGRVGSHILLWRPFITSFLINLSKCSTGIVYVLMGSQAQTLEPYINSHFNYVIRIRHPSYYARTKTRMPSDIWKQINNILINQNGYGIEWYKEY